VAAEDLLCSGRSIGAATALAIGLVHALADDPAGRCAGLFRRAPGAAQCGGAGACAQAVRAPRLAALRDDLARVERLYLNA
jgi:enoyl-CoA hydratase/carnithine racemase